MNVAEKIRNFLEKAQGWPDNKKKIVLWTIVVFIAVIMGFFWARGAMNNFSKIGENMQNIQIPQIDTSDMPTMPLFDISSVVSPGDGSVLVGTADQTDDWMKCVSNCDFYTDKILGEIINKNCIDACSGEYKLAPEYKSLDSAILFLSPEVKTCKNILDNSLREKCLYAIPQKYLIDQ